MDKMSDMITFDTEVSTNDVKKMTATKVKTFALVPENDPILKEVLPEFDFTNPPVNANEFASTLVDTCKELNGYGLSANQCGFKHRVFVVGAGDDYVAFFNPKILETKGEAHMMEGCLSFPMLGLHITRPAELVIQYQDFNGEIKSGHYIGMTARCILHELDHLNGIVYTSKAKPLALQSGMKKRNKVMKMVKKIGQTNRIN
jgi:peptide deformylase